MPGDARTGGYGSTSSGTKPRPPQPSPRIGGPAIGRPASLPVSSRITGTTPTRTTMPTSGGRTPTYPTSLQTAWRQGRMRPEVYGGMQFDAAKSLWSQLNPAVYAQADFDIATALASDAMAQSQRDAQNWKSGQDRNNVNAKADADRAALGIDAEANLRQRGYITDLYNIANGQGLINQAEINVDDNAAMRQYGLIDAERADAKNTWGRFEAENARQRIKIGEQEELTKSQEKKDQQKLISKAAASGNIGLINTLDSQTLQENLGFQMEEFTRNRATLQSERDEGFQQYSAAVRTLQEKWYATDDAREKLKLQRQREELEQKKRDREQAEGLARIEDENRQNFIRAALIELARRNGENEANFNQWFTNAAASKAAADRQAMIDAAAAAKAAEAARAAGVVSSNPQARVTSRRAPASARIPKN